MVMYDGDQILRDISLDPRQGSDDTTELALVADHTRVGKLAPELVAAAPASGEITEVRFHGSSYEVQARPMRTTTGEEYARVVMARRIDTVLSLFPGARLVFALALVGCALLAIATAIRARQVTDARV
jgi:hypothetical protein